jgi:hypothetical protein
MTTTPSNPMRERLPDLLTRPPNGTREFVAGWSHLIVDPVRQLATLADLYAMGLLSQEEYERHKRDVRDL